MDLMVCIYMNANYFISLLAGDVRVKTLMM